MIENMIVWRGVFRPFSVEKFIRINGICFTGNRANSVKALKGPIDEYCLLLVKQITQILYRIWNLSLREKRCLKFWTLKLLMYSGLCIFLEWISITDVSLCLTYICTKDEVISNDPEVGLCLNIVHDKSQKFYCTFLLSISYVWLHFAFDNLY